MPSPPIASVQELFLWKESDAPPATHDSQVVRFLVTYLLKRWVNMFATFRDFPRYPPEMFLPGYVPSESERAMESACPGDHSRWAGALMGLYMTSRSTAPYRPPLDVDKMRASLADFNQTLRKHSGPLAVLHVNSTIMRPSKANGDAYKALLLSTSWRTMTAAKQASGKWNNPSWEMFNHWVKLVACAGYQPYAILAASPQPMKGPIDDWRDKRFPPPFIDPVDLHVPGASPIVDRSVYDVFHALCTENPKLDLSGYSDTTPTRWESYSGWAGTDITPDIVDILNALPPQSAFAVHTG